MCLVAQYPFVIWCMRILPMVLRLLIHSALFHWVHVLILGIGLLLERRIGGGCYRIRLLLQFSDVAIWNKVSKTLESHRITMKWCNS